MMTTCDIQNRQGECIDHSFHPGSRPDVLVILAHGVTGNKDRPLLVALAEGLSARGWPAMRISFSGNGESDGSFEDSTITKEIGDLQAVLAMVPDDVGVAYIGHSMGAAVGVLTAGQDMRIRTLVSLAGMTYTAEFVEREFGSVVPGQGCMWDDPSCPLSQAFVQDMKRIGDTLSAAARVPQPWLLIHGGSDDVVPVRDGIDAYQSAISRKKWVEIPGAGHSFGESFYPQLVNEVDGWLKTVFA